MPAQDEEKFMCVVQEGEKKDFENLLWRKLDLKSGQLNLKII